MKERESEGERHLYLASSRELTKAISRSRGMREIRPKSVLLARCFSKMLHRHRITIDNTQETQRIKANVGERGSKEDLGGRENKREHV